MQREFCISRDQYTPPPYTEQSQGWDYTLSGEAEDM